jgi:hypothetical protein
MRGRSSRVPDPTADRLRLTAEAQREAEERQAAAAELALTGALHGATISPAARGLLLDLVADLLARNRDETVDHDVGLRLRMIPGADTVVTSPDGTTTFVGLSLIVAGTAEWASGPPSPAPRTGAWAPNGQARSQRGPDEDWGPAERDATEREAVI